MHKTRETTTTLRVKGDDFGICFRLRRDRGRELLLISISEGAVGDLGSHSRSLLSIAVAQGVAVSSSVVPATLGGCDSEGFSV
jgi:hypothetical protein